MFRSTSSSPRLFQFQVVKRLQVLQNVRSTNSYPVPPIYKRSPSSIINYAFAFHKRHTFYKEAYMRNGVKNRLISMPSNHSGSTFIIKFEELDTCCPIKACSLQDRFTYISTYICIYWRLERQSLFCLPSHMLDIHC